MRARGSPPACGDRTGGSPLEILADENIPFVREVFSHLGRVTTLSGRAIAPDAVRDADLLLVRSVTRVDERLLAGSRVRFVATATIGTDHVDEKYLSSRGIAFAAAPGSNARSVAEYVAAALLVLESRGKVRLDGATLGVVGVGNVGSRVDGVALSLGMKTLLNDPPRARREGAAGFVPLDEIAERADVVTFHVPLEKGGENPTWHMIDARFLSRLKPGAVLVNSSRGAVADSAALKEAKRSGRLKAMVLDVWEDEPAIDPELVGLADLATPHVAGYSFDGKVAGTRMIHEAAYRFLGVEARWPEDLPPREELVVRIMAPSALDAVRVAYDIEEDDARLREVMKSADPKARAEGFDRLRREYPVRREFANWRVVTAGAAVVVRSTLEALGFSVRGPGERPR